MTTPERSRGPVVVTGASSGIGRAVALALGRAGHPLVLLGRDRDRLGETAAAAGDASVHPFDLTDDGALAEFAAALPAQRLGGLVHSAGMVEIGTVAEQDVASLDRHYRLNLRAPYLLTQLLLPRLEGGTVVFVNSGAGLSAHPGWSQYCATKFALRALADSLRQEVAERGVRVTSLYPGRTATPMQRQLRRMEGGAYRPDAYLPAEEVAGQVLAVLELPAGTTVPDLTLRPG